MAKKIKYYSNTPASEKLKVLKKAGACNEALECLKSSATVMDLAINIPTDKPGWAAWDLQMFGEEEDIEIRKVMIVKIKEPMMAFRLYCTLSWLTGKEDVLLEAMFKGKLPTAEKELEDGIVTRAKGKSNG